MFSHIIYMLIESHGVEFYKDHFFFLNLGPFSETWYKAIPAVLLGSISRENPKVSVLRLFNIKR